jgi:hypothetical protein
MFTKIFSNEIVTEPCKVYIRNHSLIFFLILEDYQGDDMGGGDFDSGMKILHLLNGKYESLSSSTF